MDEKINRSTRNPPGYTVGVYPANEVWAYQILKTETQRLVYQQPTNFFVSSLHGALHALAEGYECAWQLYAQDAAKEAGASEPASQISAPAQSASQPSIYENSAQIGHVYNVLCRKCAAALDSGDKQQAVKLAKHARSLEDALAFYRENS